MGIHKGKSKSKAKKSSASITPSSTDGSSSNVSMDQSVLVMLKSSNHNHRIDACNSVATMVRPDHFAGLVSSKVLQIVADLVNDKMLAVAVAAAGCLRNICAEIGAVVATELSNQGLLKKLVFLLEQCSNALSRVTPGSTVIPADASMHWYAAKSDAVDRLLMQILAILSFLCDSSDAAVRQFTEAQAKNGGLHLAMLMGRTQLTPNSSPFALQVAIDALHFFRTVTVGNDMLNVAILGQGSILNHLINLATYVSGPTPADASVFTTLRGNMSASLTHQLARKEGAIASAFTVLNYPRVPQELSAVACSILVHLLQTASDSRVSAEQLKQIAIPLMTGLSTTMSTSDVFSHLDSALQSLSMIPATIEEIRLAKKNGTLPTPMEKDCLEDAMDRANQESSANPETAIMGEKNDAELDHDLPMDELLKDAAQMHMRVYSQFASAEKLSLDALASFLSLLPEADEEGARPTPSQLLFRQLAVDFLVNDATVKSARLDHICSLVALRLVNPTVFATGNAPVTSLSPERCAAVCSSLTEANARQLGRVFDQTRAQAATALSSAMLFLPDEALPETLVRSLLPSVSNVLTSADVVALLHVSTPANPHPNPADSTLAVCRGDEIEALISTIHQLSIKPTFKLAADRAWAQQRTPENIQQCAIVSPQTISAIATVAVSGSKNITSDIKSAAASTLGALGQSPALCEGAEAISNALLEMMLVCSRAKSTDADHDLIFEVLNAIIDMYSEDDRNVEVWKKLNMTQRLSTFVPIYSAAVRELRKSVKAKRPTPELMMRIDKAEDGLENLTQFVQYKKSIKL